MRHSIEGLRDISYTPDCRIMNNFANIYQDLLRGNAELLNQARQGIDNGLQAIEYSPDSQVAREIVNSKELREFIQNNWSNLNSGDFVNEIGKEFKTNPDLAKSLGHASILNAKLNSNGIFTAVIYDYYDFTWNKPATFTNDTAFALQSMHLLRNYFVIIYIRTYIKK